VRVLIEYLTSSNDDEPVFLTLDVVAHDVKAAHVVARTRVPTGKVVHGYQIRDEAGSIIASGKISS